MTCDPRTRTAVVLLVFAAMFAILTVGSYTQKSAVWDEPQHLTAGYTALKLRDYRVDPEHPPFLRLWAALPLLAMPGVGLETGTIDASDPQAWVTTDQFSFCHRFLYQQNDADHLLYAARFQIVLLGIALGILLFCWARELFGFATAAIVLGLYCLEPNLLAHSSLVTTDLGVTCFIFGALYFLWRATRQIRPGNLLGLLACFALACVSKFSALVLGPIVLVLLALWAAGRWRHRGPVAVGILLLLALVTWGSIWAVYGFRYRPATATTWQFGFATQTDVGERAPALARIVGWVDRHHLLPNAYSQGFLLGQAKAQQRGTFLAGAYSVTGWWYYFPAAFLMKTPVAVIALFGAGLAGCLRRWRTFRTPALFLLWPLGFYLAMAMTAHLNIGLRHILPIYPFVFLVAGLAVAELLRRNWRVLLAVVLATAVGECVRTWPDFLASFNLAVGGPANGDKLLIDSNLDWGQDLKPLQQWMAANNVSHINLSYFGTADPAYYGMDCTPLTGAPFFEAPARQSPRLPGYVAVSVTNLRRIYFRDGPPAYYHPLLQQKPVAIIGHSIRVYWVERPWWP